MLQSLYFIKVNFLEALTNISYLAGAAQTAYKLLQEVSGHKGAVDSFGELMWTRFQDSTGFKKVIEDLENSFTTVCLFYEVPRLILFYVLVLSIKLLWCTRSYDEWISQVEAQF